MGIYFLFKMYFVFSYCLQVNGSKLITFKSLLSFFQKINVELAPVFFCTLDVYQL